MKAIAAKAATAGVPFVTGTDVFDRHGAALLEELEELVAIGLTPQQVLLAATVTSAGAAGRPDLGRLQVDGPASFVIIDANPLEPRGRRPSARRRRTGPSARRQGARRTSAAGARRPRAGEHP